MTEAYIKRYANLIRNELEIKDKAIINFDSLLENKLDIHVKESESENTPYEGMIVMHNGYYGILLKPNLSFERRRFTIAHELGHYRIKEHSQNRKTFKCTRKDMNKFVKLDDIEVQANIFASEFLMPDEYFNQDIRQLNFNLASIKFLSETYKVSWMSCGYKFVKNSSEICAMIIIKDNTIQWHVGSPSFKQIGLFLEPKTKIDPWSLAYEYQNSNENMSNEPQEVQVKVWFPDKDLGCEFLTEECYNIPSIKTTVSFLLIKDDNFF